MAKRKYTLEEIRQRQDLLRLDVSKKEAELRKSMDRLRRPEAKSTTTVQRFMNRAQNATYVFEAALLGFKLYRAMGGKKLALFSRRKK